MISHWRGKQLEADIRAAGPRHARFTEARPCAGSGYLGNGQIACIQIATAAAPASTVPMAR
jgi:hypothetical protein